jgi:glycosyltransferase involved in cell wall biosynthesis
MKIGIDIRVLAKGTRTGVEDYTINLLSHLLPADKSVKYRLFYNGLRKPNLDYPFLKLPNVKLISLKIPNRFLFVTACYLNQPKIDKLLKGVNIYFNTHFFTAPVSLKCKKVMTFHDLSFERHPNFFPWRKRLWQKFFMNARQEAERADKIVVISQSTKEDLINLYKIKPEKIKLIYSGVDEKFRPIARNNPDLVKVKKKYNLPDNFILYFGTIEPRKNILGLIRAFEQVKATSQLQDQVQWQGFEGKVKSQPKTIFDFSSLRLVIAGAKGWLYNEVFKKARQSQHTKDIIFTGFIDEEDKLYLYNLAELFIYPSFFEGFGFPPLEAMACGLPSIVSNKSSLPEVVDDGAIMIDPHNIDEISWVIKEVLENQELRKYLKKQAIKRTKQFNWDKTAKEFLKLFKDL